MFQSLHGAGAGGDDRRDAMSERFGDDQSKRLDAGREYKQVSGVPSLIQSRADEGSSDADAICQLRFGNFMTHSGRIARISQIEADQVGQPAEVGESRKCAYQRDLVLGGGQRREGEQSREAGMQTPTRCGCGLYPRSRHLNISAPISSAQLGSTPVAWAHDPGCGVHGLRLQGGVPLPSLGVQTELIADR